MKTNDRFRKHAAKLIDSDETILAATNTVLKGSGHGLRASGASLSAAAGIERMREVLGLDGEQIAAGEMTIVTNRRLLFCKPDSWAVRPKPKAITFEAPLADVRLTWGEYEGATTWWVLCFRFPDGGYALREAVRGSKAMGPPDDEAVLIVEAFGDRAERVQLG